MSEAQAYLALPSFLDGVALTHYEATCESLDADEGGVTCWPEAVNYLLRSFATSNAISEAVQSLQEIRQVPHETETAFAKRLNEAHIRCGKVHSADAVVQFFLRGLDPAIKTIVESYREGHRRCTLLALIQHAQAEGDAYRARTKSSKNVSFSRHVTSGLEPSRTSRLRI